MTNLVTPPNAFPSVGEAGLRLWQRQWFGWPLMAAMLLLTLSVLTSAVLKLQKDERDHVRLVREHQDLSDQIAVRARLPLDLAALLVQQLEAELQQKPAMTAVQAFERLAKPLQPLIDSQAMLEFSDEIPSHEYPSASQPKIAKDGTPTAQRGDQIISFTFPVRSRGMVVGQLWVVLFSTGLLDDRIRQNAFDRGILLRITDGDHVILETASDPVLRQSSSIHTATFLDREWQIHGYWSPIWLDLGTIWFVMAAGVVAAAAAGLATARVLAHQRKLGASQARLHDFASIASDWFWEQDESYRFTFISSGILRFTGVSPSRVIGRRRDFFSSGGVNPERAAQHQADLDARRSFSDFRYSMVNEQGKRITLSISGVPIFDEAGSFRGYRGVGRDVTKEFEAERQLRHSEEKYRAIFHSSPAIHLLFDVETGFIRDANKAALDFYGYSRDEFVVKSIAEIDTLPMERLRQDMAKVARGESARFQFQHVLASGSVRNVEVFPGLVTVDGRACICSIVHDVTVQRRLEAELSREISFRQTLIDAIPLPVFTKDASGCYIEVNPAFERFYGLSSGSMAGKTVFDIAPHALAEVYEKADLALFASPGTQVYEAEVRDHYGAVHDVVVHKATFGPDPAKPEGLIGVILDVTDRKRTEQALADARGRLSLALELSMIGLWDWDLQHGALEFSDIALSILGYKPGELQSVVSGFLKSVHPEDMHHYRDEFARHVKGMKPHLSVELRMRHKAGHWVDVLGIGRVSQWSSEGRALRMIGVAIDVTGRSQRQAN